MAKDVLLKKKTTLFSFRVAGVLIREGRVLLQHVRGQSDYALPGGQVAMGEASPQALAREFLEETHLPVHVGRLLWVGEHFFPWQERRCHQICFYYEAALVNDEALENGPFLSADGPDAVEFCWTPLECLDELTLYPPQLRQGLCHLPEHVEHIVYTQS